VANWWHIKAKQSERPKACVIMPESKKPVIKVVQVAAGTRRWQQAALFRTPCRTAWRQAKRLSTCSAGRFPGRYERQPRNALRGYAAVCYAAARNLLQAGHCRQPSSVRRPHNGEGTEPQAAGMVQAGPSQSTAKKTCRVQTNATVVGRMARTPVNVANVKPQQRREQQVSRTHRTAGVALQHYLHAAQTAGRQQARTGNVSAQARYASVRRTATASYAEKAGGRNQRRPGCLLTAGNNNPCTGSSTQEPRVSCSRQACSNMLKVMQAVRRQAGRKGRVAVVEVAGRRGRTQNPNMRPRRTWRRTRRVAGAAEAFCVRKVLQMGTQA
jgi:hypothetical protein